MSDTYEFKVGDKVLLTSYSGRKISVVEKITPKGFIQVTIIILVVSSY